MRFWRHALSLGAVAATATASPGQTQAYKLTASDGAKYDRFGTSVAIDGGLAVVGTPDTDDQGIRTGSAYVFDVTTGQQLFKLVASDGAQGDRFGLHVAIHGDRAIVGAWWDDDHGSRSGSAYIFDVTTGREVFKHAPFDGTVNDQYGVSVAISASQSLVGANLDDDLGLDSGSAYVNPLPTVVGTNYCGPANPNSTGSPGAIVAIGSDVAADNLIALTATGLPPGQFGYFIVSQTQGFIPSAGGSQGNLCLGGSIGRFRKQIRKSGSTGEFGIPVDLASIPTSPPQAVMAGETWNFQAWFRDSAVKSSNFTDAASVVFQ